MTQISKKAYKGLPVGVKVRKPRYYYQDIITVPEIIDNKAYINLNLVKFVGVDYSFNNRMVTIEEKLLWNGYTFNSMSRVLAPSGEDYLTSIDDSVISAKGCLDGVNDVDNEVTYSAFVKNDEILLSESDDDREGYSWIGYVTVPQHEVKDVYKVNYNTIGSVNYDTDFNVNDFSASNYILTPEMFGENPYTFITKIKISSQDDGNMILVANNDDTNPFFYLQKASKTLSVNNGSVFGGTTVIPVDEWYWVKLVWDGETLKWYTAPYVENSYFEPSWTLENSVAQNIFNTKQVFRLGSSYGTNTTYYMHGAIDLINTKYFENNELVWQALNEV